ncbi:42653_t:CDS:2 [Gigaspora margarita]|uniref:42653_t:CDS:1 n=1 Tax=Gigaspora margarita TaxID=4874 RepID=A0ABN7UUJ8_GIGMA|nr:42653_t:CDS:2 [Gigaspora margarita]
MFIRLHRIDKLHITRNITQTSHRCISQNIMLNSQVFDLTQERQQNFIVM